MSGILKEVESFFGGAENDIVSAFEREDKAIVVRTEKVLHEARNVAKKIEDAVTSSPAGETVTAFAERLKGMF